MSMRSSIPVCILSATLLAGCNGGIDQLAKLYHIDPVTIVIPPGYPIKIGEKTARVFGRNPCMQTSMSRTFWLGPSLVDTSDNGLVITPLTAVVHVRVLVDGMLQNEIWTVKRERNETALIRPGGDPVVLSYE